MRSAFIAAPALALLLTTAANAQAPAAPAASNTAPPLMTAPRPDDKATTDPKASPSGVGGSAPSNEMKNAAPVRSPGLDPTTARELVGHPVQTRDGKAAGMVRDFTLSGQGGKIDQVVLGSGAFIGAEVEMISVPASKLRLDAPDSASTPPPSEKPTTRLSLDMTADELNRAPPFAYNDKTSMLVGNK